MKLTKYRLGEIAEICNGATPSSQHPEYFDGDIIWLTPKDLSDQRAKYIYKGERCITQEAYESCSTHLLPKGTILMSSRAPIGLLAIAGCECCTNQGFKNIVVDNSICDSEYLFYYLKHNMPKIIGLGSGTTFLEVSKASLEKHEVSLPQIDIQNKIAKVLAFLDRKIALNREINRNLEAMARQLYDYWFVQFDFPDENGKPYKSSGGKMVWNEKLKREIPECWEVSNLFDSVDVQYGFPFSTDLFVEEQTEIPIVRIRDILNGTVSAYTTEETDSKYKLSKGDVLIGMDGNFHMNLWCDDFSYLNQRCVRIRQIYGSQISALQVMFEVAPYIKAKEQNAKGSTVGHLSDKDLKGLWIMRPHENSFFNPASQFNVISNLIVENRIEISYLIAQRDELLPLLMNGQVSVMPTEVNCDLSLY